MKTIIALLLGICFLTTSFKSIDAKKPGKIDIKTVVIDAGHGGHDVGCLGSSSREKDMALRVALKLGKLIEDNLGDVSVVYTRQTDTFIELHKRADIANKNNADLFICIHFNSGAKTAFGVETFAMGLHKSAANLEVAKRENSSILQEQNYLKQYDGFDPNSEEATIIFTLYQNAHLDQSLAFASRVQEKFKRTGRFDRGVKQAGFLVLWRTNMPAVLIENGFLTNKEEQNYFKNGNGVNKSAVSIFKAFREYKAQAEGEPIPKDDEPFIGMEAMSKIETYKAPVEEPKADAVLGSGEEATPDSFKLKNLKADTVKATTMSRTELEAYKEQLKKEKEKTQKELAEIKRNGEKAAKNHAKEQQPEQTKPEPTATTTTTPDSEARVCYRVQFYGSPLQMALLAQSSKAWK